MCRRSSTIRSTSALRQLESLHLWAAACRKGQLAATHVARDEGGLEGLYYLVVLLCVPYTLEKDTCGIVPVPNMAGAASCSS